MTSRDFAFWLQGFFEVSYAGLKDVNGNAPQLQLDTKQTAMIEDHLKLVFKHDPTIRIVPEPRPLPKTGLSQSELVKQQVVYGQGQGQFLADQSGYAIC